MYIYSFCTLAVKEIDLSVPKATYFVSGSSRRFREGTLATEIVTLSAVTVDSVG